MDFKTEIEAIFGVKRVENRPEVLAQYAGESRYSPVCSVKLLSSEEVQRLVKWAYETNTPLIPVSSNGSFHRHGAAAPSKPGCVIADLSCMKKILSINYEFRMVTLEPGVTYAELAEALVEKGLCLDMPVAPKSGKSVIASVLEGEPITRPFIQWNAPHPLRCTEVVWGDGTKMYTGEANMGGKTIEQQQAGQRWQINPCGPAAIDYYRLVTGAQGTMGIVTWASLKCSLLDNMHQSFLIPSDSEDAVIDWTYKMIHNRMCDEIFMANRAYLEALTGAKELPAWVGFSGFSGRPLCPELRLDACAEAVEIAAGQCSLKAVEALPSISGEELYKISVSEQSGSKPDWRIAAKGGFKELAFLSTMDKVPAFTDIMFGLADKYGFRQDSIGIYLQPVNTGVGCHIEFFLPFDPMCVKESVAVNAIIADAPDMLMDSGAYFIHPYSEAITKLQLARNPENTLVAGRLKAIFDPKGIMNPGKLQR